MLKNIKTRNIIVYAFTYWIFLIRDVVGIIIMRMFKHNLTYIYTYFYIIKLLILNCILVNK